MNDKWRKQAHPKSCFHNHSFSGYVLHYVSYVLCGSEKSYLSKILPQRGNPFVEELNIYAGVLPHRGKLFAEKIKYLCRCLAPAGQPLCRKN